jgi:hypothetical protein
MLADVCFWHKADDDGVPMSAFDPKRMLAKLRDQPGF